MTLNSTIFYSLAVSCSVASVHAAEYTPLLLRYLTSDAARPCDKEALEVAKQDRTQ
jgi:hypothetical protein